MQSQFQCANARFRFGLYLSFAVMCVSSSTQMVEAGILHGIASIIEAPVKITAKKIAIAKTYASGNSQFAGYVSAEK